jgi:hypothetical protein
MSGLIRAIFGGGGGGGGDNGAAAREMIRQQQLLAKQEADLNKKESNLAVKTQAGVLARRGGGSRSLLSKERADKLGLEPTTLGGGSGMA